MTYFFSGATVRGYSLLKIMSGIPRLLSANIPLAFSEKMRIFLGSRSIFSFALLSFGCEKERNEIDNNFLLKNFKD
jgi:hypothetical protein